MTMLPINILSEDLPATIRNAGYTEPRKITDTLQGTSIGSAVYSTFLAFLIHCMFVFNMLNR